LAPARFERKDLQLLIVAIDEAAEKEAAGRTGDEHIAVEGARIFSRLEHVTPELVSSAVITHATRDEHGNLSLLYMGWDDDRGFASCHRTARAKEGSHLELRLVAAFNKVLGLDSQSIRNAIEPAYRNRAGTSLEPANRLRRRRRVASTSDIVERHGP
jgi:hypothetical protein